MSDMERDSYDEALSAARYRAERDQARQELERIKAEMERVERECEDISGRDSDVLVWVEANGGLDAVQAKCYLADEAAKTVTGRRVGMSTPDSILGELRCRLMPEGMEWMVEAWPRFEDGEPVRFEDEWCLRTGGTTKVGQVVLVTDWSFALNASWYEPGERVKRPAKVLDADGAEIELSDDLYSVEGGLKFHVSHIDRINGKIATDAMFSLDKWADPAMYTHRAPVLAADGRPLREGETVWEVKTGDEYVVERVYSGTTEPDFPGHTVACLRPDDVVTHMFKPSQLTHERPDSWERLEEELGDEMHRQQCGPISPEMAVDVARKYVRRAMALAGVE